MRQREQALKQSELEYKERMNNAVQGLEQKVANADNKARSLNRQLDQMKKKSSENAIQNKQD